MGTGRLVPHIYHRIRPVTGGKPQSKASKMASSDSYELFKDNCVHRKFYLLEQKLQISIKIENTNNILYTNKNKRHTVIIRIQYLLLNNCLSV